MNISCTPSNAFDIKSNSISLKQYPDDLLMYFSGEDTGLNLAFGEGLLSPYIPTKEDEHVRVKQDSTGFPYTFVDDGYELTYYKNNFRNFIKGTIRLTVKKESCKYDYGYQDLSEFNSANAGYYEIFLASTKNGTSTTIPISIVLNENVDDIHELSTIINNVLNENVDGYNFITTETIGNDTLRFRTKPDEGAAVAGHLSLAMIGNEGSLLKWFNVVHEPSYFSAPEKDTKFISIHELNSSNNEISLIHKEDGYIYLFMSDENSEYTLTKKICSWDWDNEEFREIEINFDDSLSNIIVNGEGKAFFETVGVDASGTKYDSIIRSQQQSTYLTLVGGGDAYGFKEIDVFNKKQHCGSYTPPEHITYYDGKAYIEYHLGDIDVFDDSTLNIEGSGGMFLEALDDGVTISYVDEQGNPVTVASGDIDDFIKKFKGINYDENSPLSFEATDLTFRVTFLDKNSVITKFDFDPGTSKYDYNDPYNFEDLYAWVRRQLGAPQVACELTDDQIYDALCKAVEKYNKYRNWNESINIADIDGTEETDLKKVDGGKAKGTYFQIPANIADTDIIDIFFQPRFSTCWFGAGDTFLNNVMAQTFFGLYGGIVQNSADYYIWRVSCNDISNIIGTQVSWRIYDHHLYFTPNNLKDLDQFRVGIKYRPALTIEEIRNNENIKALTLGYAMKTLGIIRGTFGGSVQAGDIAVQLNAETLLNEGDKLINDTIALLKSEQKPLWIIWS